LDQATGMSPVPDKSKTFIIAFWKNLLREIKRVAQSSMIAKIHEIILNAG